MRGQASREIASLARDQSMGNFYLKVYTFEVNAINVVAEGFQQ